MKAINIIKIRTKRVSILTLFGLLFLLPSISNAQIQRVWSIAEYTSTMLPPPATGTKVAYRTLNNSLFYWNGSAWIRIAGPGIVDTSYSLSFSSPTLSLLGSGSSVSLTDLYTAGYGLTKTGETWKADSALLATKLYTNRFLLKSDTPSMLLNYPSTAGYGIIDGGKTWRADTTSPNGLATRVYARTLPTLIGSGQVAYSNGSTLVGSLNHFWDNSNIRLGLGTNTPSYTLDINSTNAIRLSRGTDAERPTNAFGLLRGNTTGNGLEFGNGTNWSYLLRSSLAGGVGTADRVLYIDANGFATDNANFTYTPASTTYATLSHSSGRGIKFDVIDGIDRPNISTAGSTIWMKISAPLLILNSSSNIVNIGPSNSGPLQLFTNQTYFGGTTATGISSTSATPVGMYAGNTDTNTKSFVFNSASSNSSLNTDYFQIQKNSVQQFTLRGSGFFGFGATTPSAKMHISDNISAASWTTNGIGLRIDNATYTNTTSSGTVALQAAHRIGVPTFASTTSTVLTSPVNFYIAGIPAMGTNTTVGGDSYALYVDGGGVNANNLNTRVAGSIWAAKDGRYASAYYAQMNSSGTENIVRVVNAAGAVQSQALVLTQSTPITGATNAIGISNSGTGFFASGGALDINEGTGGTINIKTANTRFYNTSGSIISQYNHNTGFLGLNTAGAASYFLDLNSTDAIRIARGTDAQRPTNAVGLLRWNTTGLGPEVGNGTNWSYLTRTSIAGGVGTNTYVPHFGSDGYLTQSIDFRWDQTNRAMFVGSATTSLSRMLNVTHTSATSDAIAIWNRNTGNAPPGISFFNGTSTDGPTSSLFTLRGYPDAANTGGGFSLYSAQGGGTYFMGGNVNGAQTNGIFYGTTAPFIFNNVTTVFNNGIVIGNDPLAGTAATGGTIRSGMKTNAVTDVAGSNLTFQAGNGTGASTGGGNLIFQTPDATVSGTALQAYTTKFNIGRTNTYSTQNFGVKTTTPLEDAHIAGDLRVDDSTKLVITPVHTTITGVATFDGNKWVGIAALRGGLSYTTSGLRAADSLKYWSNVLFVSPNGNDATAIKNKMTSPWLTPDAAKTAATSGDLIVVLTGSYSATNLWKPGVDWHFENVTINNNLTSEYTFNTAIFKATSSGTMRITGNLTTGQLLQVDTADVNIYAEGNQLGQVWIGPGSHRANIHLEAKNGNSQIYVAATSSDSIKDNTIYYHTKFINQGNAVGIRHNNNSTVPTRNSITWEADVVDYGNTSVFFTDRGMIASQSVSNSFTVTKLNMKIGKGVFNSTSNEQLLALPIYPTSTNNRNELTLHCDDCEFRGSSTLSRELRLAGIELSKITGKYTTYSTLYPLITNAADHSNTNRVIFSGEFIGQDTTLLYTTAAMNWQLEGNWINKESDDFAVYTTNSNGSTKPILKNFYVNSTATTPIQSTTATTWYTAGAFDYNTITQDADITFATENEYKTAAKRDTTIYVVDADYDFSAALTTTQISRRYNRVIFLMTTTAAAGSDSELTLHTPDVNLMQVEYLIRSTDETGGFTNVIKFGTNNAVASDNALASTYTPSPGQGVGIRAGLRSGVYKYYYY